MAVVASCFVPTLCIAFSWRNRVREKNVNDVMLMMLMLLNVMLKKC